MARNRSVDNTQLCILGKLPWHMGDLAVPTATSGLSLEIGWEMQLSAPPARTAALTHPGEGRWARKPVQGAHRG